MTNLNRKLLTIYLALGILFFIAVIYLFVKNEILPDINSDLSHNVRVTSVRVIKNEFFNQQLLENNHRNTDEEIIDYNSIQEKEQSYFLFVNETDKATYAKSTSFHITLSNSPFSIRFQDDALIPLTTLNDKYRLDIQEDGKTIGSFEVPKLNPLFAIDKKSDTVTLEKTIKLISSDKSVILYLIFTID